MLSKKIRSSNESLSMSPSKLTTTRTGESSLFFLVLSAFAISSSTFQRQVSSGYVLGSSLNLWTSPEAEASALALTTVLPVSVTSVYWVGFLNLDSVQFSQPRGTSSLGLFSEKLLT